MTDDERTAGRFVHLHNHTEYSALDGIARITDAAAAAAADGQPAMAITDHGSLAGTAAFVRVAKAAGVKPVLGIEAYTAIGSRLERNALAVLDDDPEADADADARGKRGARTKTKRYGHLTLLARNTTGWRNLVAMHNRSQQDESYWYKPRIDMELLAAHADGITALSGCLGGDVAGNVLRGRPDAAAKALNTLGDILGPENVHVELMDHGIPAERAVLPGLLELAREFAKRRPRGSRRQLLVATNDCHHTRADDAVAHDAWLAVGTKSVLRDMDRFHFDGTGYHVRTAAEMRGLAAELGPDWADVWNLACDNTLAVAERVDADVLPPFRLRLPLFDTPDGSTVEEHFLAQVRAGAHRRYGPVLPQAVRERLNLEYRVIAEKGFLGYFLIVADLIGWARSQGILTGPGRGSSAGSLSALCLGIVNVDPLEHRLLFERFMAPDRSDMPDIDVDFDPAHDDEVLAYLTRRYGADRVARIGTLGRSRSRRAILDSARVLELADAGAALAKAVPVAMGKPMPLEQMLDGQDPAADQFRELAARPDEARVLDLAVRMEGVAASPGIHACGVLISDEPMTDLVPLRRDRKDDGRGGWVTEWEAPDLEKAGFLKLDTLMLRNLRVVQLCVRMVADRLGVDVDVDRLPTAMSDPRAAATWDLLRRGNTAQVFQLDSGGMRDLVVAVGPESLGDLSAVMALYRPGPMGAGMHLHYAARKRGDEPVDYGIFTADPAEEKVIAGVLGDTFGVPVYQEQLMQLGEHVAGFGPVERSRLRVAVSKKKAAEMAVVGELFVAGAQREMRYADGAVTKRAFAAATARALWAAIESAGSYSFNKSHSVAYGAIAYVTAYLKANYPAEYSAAVLTCTKDADKRQSVLLSLAADGVQVLGPSVNDGLVSTGVTADGLVRLGTGEIKGVSSSAVAAVHAERAAGGPFTSLRDMLDRVRIGTDDAAREPDDDPDTTDPDTPDPDDEPGKPAAGRMPVSVVEGLIEAGALDDLGPRLGLMMTARSICAADLPVPDAEWGVVEASRRERERTGVSLTRRPLVDLRGQVSAYRWRAEDDWGVPLGGRPVPVHLLPQIDRAPTLTVGVVTEWGERAYRGGWMAKFTLEGSRGVTSGVMWNDTLESLRRADRVPGVGDVVCIRGRVVHREVTVTVSDPDAEGGETQQVETRLELMAHDVRAVPLDDPARVELPAGPLPRLQLVADTPTGAQFVRQLDTTDAPPPARSAAVPPAITAGAPVDDSAPPPAVAARRPGGPEVLAVFLTPGSSLWLSVGRRERSLLTGLLPALSSPKTAAQLATLDEGQWTQPLVTTNPNLRVVFVACDRTADDALVRLAPADAHAALGPGMTDFRQDPTLELVPAGDDPTVTADAWAPGDPFPGQMVLFEVPGLDVDTELVLRFDPGHVGNRPVAA